MRKNLPIAGLLLAWLCANGALLDAVQVFAWGKMFAGYAGTMSTAAALRATFDPAKPCHLCVEVATMKETAQKQLPQTVEHSSEKLVLAFHTPAKIILVNAPDDWPPAFASAAPSRFEPVPVPPPRV